MDERRIVLGSSSPFRRCVLERAGYQFEVVTPDIDEKAIRNSNPYILPLLIANAKLAVLRPKLAPPGILITADQVVVCNGQLREKPTDENEAAEFLTSYAIHPAETVSALIVCNLESGKRAGAVDHARVFFGPMSPDVINEYIRSGSPFLNAGGFDHEHPISKPYIREIEGTSDSVMGMPLHLLRELMAKVT